MNRCITHLLHKRSALLSIAASAIAACAIGTFSFNASAQVRDFPEAAWRGLLEVTAPPQVLLDGKAEQLAPGARIHGTNNMLLMSGSLVGQKIWVNYTRDIGGTLSEVWILTEAEAALERQGTRPARFFFF